MNSRLRSIPRTLAQSALVGKSRRAAGLFVAPVYHGHITSLHARGNDHEARLQSLERLQPLVQHMPALLNAIATVNGTTRLMRREFDATVARVDAVDAGFEQHAASVAASLDALRAELDGHVRRLDGHVRDELWPTVARTATLDDDRKTLRWLIDRVESVRAELMYELRYGGVGAREGGGERPAARVVNPAALDRPDGLRLNLGCGLLTMDGYVNIDMRELPGVDVVAGVDDLPFEPGTVTEVFSAHTLEHFPQEELSRHLLPYWRTLLAPGGTVRAVVPDLDAMIGQYQRGEIGFEQLRLIAYGGQEYEGDFHHTAFTPDSLGALLEAAGYVDVRVIERGRPNGDCLEFEIVAHRPT